MCCHWLQALARTFYSMRLMMSPAMQPLVRRIVMVRATGMPVWVWGCWVSRRMKVMRSASPSNVPMVRSVVCVLVVIIF